MQNEKNKKRGLIILILGTVSFFLLYSYFDLSDGKINYMDTISLLKFILTTAIIPVTLYLGLRSMHSKKLAMQIGGGLGILLVIAFILNFILY